MKQLDRRKVIEMSALALLGIQFGCGGDNGVQPKTSSPAKPDALDAVETLAARGLGAGRKALAAAERTGKVWLDAQAAPPSARTLFEGFMSDLPQDPQRYADWIRKRHHADFEANRVERVSGWILSRTEAQLYALLSLTAPSP